MEISLPSSPIVMKGKRLLFDESPRPLIVEKSFDALIFSKLDIDPNQDFSFEEPSHEEKRVKKEKKRVKKDKAEKKKKRKEKPAQRDTGGARKRSAPPGFRPYEKKGSNYRVQCKECNVVMDKRIASKHTHSEESS